MTLENKPFENNVGKGENAGNQHFLLFPQCFLPIPKRNFVFNRFPKQAQVFTCLQYKSFENTMRKGEIALFPSVFSTHMENFLPFSSNLELSSANSFSLEESKICHLGKG